MCAFIWATMTKFQRLGSLHTDIYFSQSQMLTILIKTPADSVSGENPLFRPFHCNLT